MKNLSENIPEKLFALLEAMARDFPSLLKDNLVGIYLWGSLTYDGFDERCSDADAVVVTRKGLNKREFSALDEWFGNQLKKNPWTGKLDMRFFIDGEFLDKNSRCVGYHFGKLTRHGSDANPFFWINIAESGITLWGKPAKAIAPKVPPEVLNAALFLELDYLKEGLPKYAGDKSDEAFFYTSYAVLTACRIFYTAFNRKLVSKDTASNFALENLPEKWRSIIQAAKIKRIKGKGAKTAKYETDAINFVHFIESRVKTLFQNDFE